MKVLVLGGQNPTHFDWVRELREIFEEAGMLVVLHDYAHWLRDEPNIDFAAELKAITALAADLGDYIIVAKSIGTILATVGIAQDQLQPKATVFLGFPLKSFEHNEDVASALSHLPTTIFVQNEHDPLGSYDDLQTYLQPLVPPTSIMIPLSGETHNYTDFTMITQLAQKLIAAA